MARVARGTCSDADQLNVQIDINSKRVFSRQCEIEERDKSRISTLNQQLSGLMLSGVINADHYAPHDTISASPSLIYSLPSQLNIKFDHFTVHTGYMYTRLYMCR